MAFPYCSNKAMDTGSVAAAVADFLEETELTKTPKTLTAYTTTACRMIHPHMPNWTDLWSGIKPKVGLDVHVPSPQMVQYTFVAVEYPE